MSGSSDSRQIARLELLAVVTAVLGAGSLFAASQLDQLSREGRLPHVSIAFSSGPSKIASLDSLPRPTGPGLPGRTGRPEDATASIPARFAQNIILDPCTGAQK